MSRAYSQELKQSDQASLQLAIKRALEKERLELGIEEDVEPKMRFLAQIACGLKIRKVENTDAKAFIREVETFQKAFPNASVYLFIHTITD